MDRYVIKLFSLLVFSSFSQAETAVEIWECKDLYDTDWSKIIVNAQVYEGREKGTVKAAGMAYSSDFSVKGFTREWNFDKLNYVLKLYPNGRGSYFDFTESKPGQTVASSMSLECRQQQIEQQISQKQ